MSAATGDILISDGGVEISESNALKFARTDNQSDTEQTINNRLLTQMTVPFTKSNWSFFQKFSNSSNGGAGDTIPTQIATIHTINSFIVKNFEDDSNVDTIAVPTASKTINDTTYGNVSFYDFQIDISAYGGWYYVIATINTSQTYQCEPFYVSNFDNSKGVLISWYNDSDSDYDDGIDYTASPVNLMRLDARFFHFLTGGEISEYTGFLGRMEILQGQPLEFCNLELSGMPFWMMRKINIAAHHDYFFVNNERWVLAEGFRNEWIKDTYINHGSLLLQKYDFENYTQYEAVTPTTSSRIKYKDTAGYLKYKDGAGYIKYK